MESKQPLMRGRKSKVIIARSSDRQPHEEASRFSVSFDDYDMQQVKFIAIRSALIPNTIYNVDDERGLNNNVLDIIVGITPVQIVFQRGFYSITSLVDAFNTNPTSIANNLTMSYDSDLTYTVQISHPSELISIQSSGTINRVLGFITNVDNAGQQQKQGDAVIDLSGVDECYIHCETFAGSNAIEQRFFRNLVTEVQMTSAFGRSVFYQNYNEEINHFNFEQPTNLSVMRFSLRDNDRNRVNLNGHDWSCVLYVEYD